VAAPQLAAAGRGDLTRARALQADTAVTRPYTLAVRTWMAALQAQITSMQAHVTTQLTAGQRRLLADLVAVCVMVAVIVAGAVLAVRRWLLRPVSALRQAVGAVAEGRYDTPVPAVGPAELADLGRAAELMRARLVTTLAEAERAEAKFRGLLETAPNAAVCVDGDGRIALVNAQTERIFGYGRDELIGQPVEMLVPDAVRDAHPGHRAGYLADPRSRPMGAGTELAGRRRDGTTFPAEISLSAIHTDEGILVTAVVYDVTERLEIQAERERLRAQAERDRMERQMHQSQRLESLGQLAGGVAHDFNNLLGVISNYASFVGDEVARELPSRRWQAVHDDIGQVEQAAQRAAGLTHQLLAFARQEVIQPRVVDLNEVVTSVEQLLTRTLGEHVELVSDLAEDLESVLADPGQIEQVLVNLAVNARDAMPGGGKLIIQTTNTDLGQPAAGQARLAPGRYVAVKVSDTGTGIPKDVVDRVFEPFFSTKPKGEGTGLGLATVYGIITQAGGTVRIYSELGLGTVCTILLPVTAQAAAVPAQRSPPQRGHGETVLVVEDEPAMREVTRRILERNGYHVTAAASGHDALQALTGQLEHVDLLLTDVVMPRMQGRELADKICVLRPGIRVAFMSGYTQGLLSQQRVLEPGVHLIEKPFTETTLLAKVREILTAEGNGGVATHPGVASASSQQPHPKRPATGPLCQVASL
jgi:PAS domain S-box-containing protein